MTDTLLIQKAIEEIDTKSFGVTEQFLKIHEVIYEENKPKIARVDTEKNDGTAIVYFPVKDQEFYMAVYLDTQPDISVRSIYIEPYHCVSFKASSKTLPLGQLAEFTTLKTRGGWNKGDKMKSGNATYKDSLLVIEPNPEVDEFDDKMNKLLNYLEQDPEGINKLVDSAGGYIQVASIFHNGNTMLGGNHLNKEMIRRMSNLNLAIDFDLYAKGEFYTD